MNGVGVRRLAKGQARKIQLYVYSTDITTTNYYHNTRRQRLGIFGIIISSAYYHKYEEMDGVGVGVSWRDKVRGGRRKSALNVLQNDFGIHAGCWRRRQKQQYSQSDAATAPEAAATPRQQQQRRRTSYSGVERPA